MSAAQVQPLAIALALIAPIDGPAPILMHCQQPFHIGAIQYNVLEGIDALASIGLDGAAVCEKGLAWLIDLGLCAPGLTQTLPVGFPGHAIVEQAHIEDLRRSLLRGNDDARPVGSIGRQPRRMAVGGASARLLKRNIWYLILCLL